MSDNISRDAAVVAANYVVHDCNVLPGTQCAICETAIRIIAAIRSLPAAPAPQPVIPPEVKLALRVLLNHVEPGWDNCKTVVQLWLDAAPAPQPWTEGELAKAMHAERLEREGCRSNYADERWDESKADRERWYASARVALSRALVKP